MIDLHVDVDLQTIDGDLHVWVRFGNAGTRFVFSPNDDADEAERQIGEAVLSVATNRKKVQ